MPRIPLWSKVALPAVVVAGVAAIGVTSAGNADRRRVLREEWEQTLACLAQGAEPKDARALAARIRAVELRYATGVEARRGRQLRKAWLARCAGRATRLQEIARRAEGGASSRLLDAADEIGDSLRASRRPTRDALQDLLEAGAEVGLDTRGLPAPQAGPVEGQEPKLSLAEPAPRPLAEAALSLTAWDPVPDLDAHLILEAGGDPQSPRIACLATKRGTELLGTVRCARVPDGASEQTKLRFEAASGTDTHALAMVDTDKVTLHTWRDGVWTPTGFATGELETLMGVAGAPTALVQSPDGDVELVTLAALGAPLGDSSPRRLAHVRAPAWALPIGSDLVWATPAAGPVRGRILASPLDRARDASPPVTTIGERIETGVPLACEDGPTRALLLDRQRPGGSSAVARSTELFVARDGGWTQVNIVPMWTTRPTVGVAFPRTPVLDCWRDDVVVTWADGDDQDRLKQTRCSQKGCRQKVAQLAVASRDLLHADLGEKVLLVWNDAEHRIVRFRLAAFEALATTRDEVLVDYDDDTSDPPPVRAEHIVTRDDTALVLLRVERKEGTQIVAVRIDTKGAVAVPEISQAP
jgi:hypothetical protein